MELPIKHTLQTLSAHVTLGAPYDEPLMRLFCVFTQNAASFQQRYRRFLHSSQSKPFFGQRLFARSRWLIRPGFLPGGYFGDC
jgi:hypothetical protein